jgi:hypothetical protein
MPRIETSEAETPAAMVAKKLRLFIVMVCLTLLLSHDGELSVLYFPFRALTPKAASP